MGVPDITILASAVLNASAGDIAVGDVMIDDTSDGTYVKATTANRGSRRSKGISLRAFGSNLRGAVRLQTGGLVSATVTGLGAGAVSWVRVSSTGRCERVTPGSGDDLLGKCDALGNLFLQPGTWDSTNYTSSGGGTPGGSSGDLQTNNAGSFGGLSPGTSGNLCTSNGSAWTSTAPSFAASVIASGQLVHERGGLEADVSAYNGLVRIASGSTSAVALPLSAANGGTGADTSSSSGVLKVTTGTWATITLASGMETFWTTPSGANLAATLTSALPASKGGTGATSAGSSGDILVSNGTVFAAQAPAFAATVITSGALATARGGTGQDSSGWTGLAFVNAGTWSAVTAPTGAIVGDDDIQTLEAKTIVAASNTITDTSAAAGDLLVHNGTRYVRLAKGSALQVLRVNSGATGLEFAAVSATPAGSSGDIQTNNAGAFGALTPGTGVATWIANPSSANLAAAVTGETGSGALVFGTNPTLTYAAVANTTSGGSINDCTLGASAGSTRRVRFADAAGPTVTGFDATGVADGTILRVIAAGGTVAVTHEDAGSSAANRVILQSGTTINIAAGCWTAFEYDATASRWRHIGATAI